MCGRSKSKNGRPSDIAKELEDIFKAYSFSGDKGNAAVRFLPIDRLNMILAVAPNPGTFAEVEKWIQKLDIPAKVTAGSIDNYVYKLKYGRAEILGGVINQLYGGCGFTSGGAYGGMPGNSTYPATGYAGLAPASDTAAADQGYGFGAGANPYGGASQYGAGGYGAAAVMARAAEAIPAAVDSACPASVNRRRSALAPVTPLHCNGSRAGRGDSCRNGRTGCRNGRGRTDQTGSYLSPRRTLWPGLGTAHYPESFRQHASRAGHVRRSGNRSDTCSSNSMSRRARC